MDYYFGYFSEIFLLLKRLFKKGIRRIDNGLLPFILAGKRGYCFAGNEDGIVLGLSLIGRENGELNQRYGRHISPPLFERAATALKHCNINVSVSLKIGVFFKACFFEKKHLYFEVIFRKNKESFIKNRFPIFK